MDKFDIEKKLKELDIPAASEERKRASMQAATEEYASVRAEAKDGGEKIKGSTGPGRLTGERRRRRPFKGGPVMTRPVFITASLLAFCFVLTLSLMTFYKSPDLFRSSGNVGGLKDTAARTEVAPVSKVEPSARAGDEKSTPGQTGAREAGNKTLMSKPSDDRDAQAGRGGAEKAPEGEKMARADRAEPAKEVAANEAEAPTSRPNVQAPGVVMQSKPAKVREEVFSSGYGLSMQDQVRPGEREYAGRDRFTRTKPNPVKLVTDEPVSTFSIDVDTASYAFVRRALNEGHLPQKDAVRVEELINYFDYDYEVPKSRTEPFKSTVAVYPTPWNPETRLLHIGIKGHSITGEKRPRANLVFLIDVSGSMSSADKLPLLKNSLKMLVNELAPDDTIAIAVYAGAAGTVLEPTSVKDKGRILATLDHLSSGGSTAGGAGIKLAYSLAEANFDPKAVNRVILATDGDFNVGIRNPDELKGFVERKRNTGVYLSVLGFGQGNYNDELMQKLAQNGNGNAAYIDTLSEARKVLVDEAGSTLFTIAKDVKLQVEFNPERVAEYRLIGYESRMLRREDFRNDQVDAGDIGAGHSVTAIYEITPVGSASGLITPLRYGKAAPASPEAGKGAEYAFLKIRYKLPDEEKSRLITRPIESGAEFGDPGKVPADVRFAGAVAAFGQILRGDPYTKGFGYGDVIKLAEPVRGRDRFGYRAEFLNLVRLAETASDMGEK